MAQKVQNFCQQNPAVALTRRTSGLFLEDKSATIVVEEDTTPETVPAKAKGKGHATRGSKGGGKSWDKVARIRVRKDENLAEKAIPLEKDLLEVVGPVEGVTLQMFARKDKAKARQ